MSEKIYACLLRLFPSAFRRHYEKEALRLLRDRLENERGFYRRLRLGFDLIMDMIGALPQAYRNCYAEVAAVGSLTPQFDGVPSFRVLQKEPVRRGVIVVACVLTSFALAIFALLLDQPISYHSPERSDPRFYIESVIRHLHEPISPDSTNKFGSGMVPGRGNDEDKERKVYSIGGNVSAPVPLNMVKAEFTSKARQAKHEGVCLIALIVDSHGSPEYPHVVRALGMGLDEKALVAVSMYKFRPAMKDGKIPVAVRLTIAVNFRLQ